jgi:hypothetical protein
VRVWVGVESGQRAVRLDRLRVLLRLERRVRPEEGLPPVKVRVRVKARVGSGPWVGLGLGLGLG